MTISPSSWPTKNTPEVADYKIDWTKKLAGDKIATSVFSLKKAAGLEIQSQSNDDTTSTIWLKLGGTEAGFAEIYCIITTTGLRTWDETVTMRVEP